MKNLFIILLLFPFIFTFGESSKKIEFPSKDGLTITADLYSLKNKNAPFIILFHQTQWSRGEYLEIAPKLNKIGFNYLAVDLRSGKEVNGVKNETYHEALKYHKPHKYINSYIDIETSVKYVKDNFFSDKIIIWGSSYSSTLVIHYAGENSKKIDGVLSFSPGEYFSKSKSRKFITNSAKK